MTHITTAFIHLYICTTYVDYVKLHVYVPYTLVLLESAATTSVLPVYRFTSTATLLSSLIHTCYCSMYVDPCSPKDALIHLYLLYVSNSTNRWCLEFSFADFCGGGPDVQT